MKKVKYKSKKKREPKNIKRIVLIVIVIIAILAVLTAGFFTLRSYHNDKLNEAVAYGLDLGRVQTIIYIMNLSFSCEPIPLYAGNTTVEMISTNCLQPQPQQITQ